MYKSTNLYAKTTDVCRKILNVLQLCYETMLQNNVLENVLRKIQRNHFPTDSKKAR